MPSSIAASPFHIPTNTQEFQSLHILSNTYFLSYFLIVAILVGMKCYLFSPYKLLQSFQPLKIFTSEDLVTLLPTDEYFSC